MPDPPRTSLDPFWPVIKTRWAARLRAAPPAPPGATALVTPAMLAFMLDDSLARLRAGPAMRADAGCRSARLPAGKMRENCECGLHLLLAYYLAGARAVKETLPAALGPERIRVLRNFTRMARTEMAALCSHCGQRGRPLCGLRPGRDNRPGAGITVEPWPPHPGTA